MEWYGAHIVMTVKFKDGNQDSFPTWENIYLIQANTPEEAELKAITIGKEQEGDSGGTFTWNNRPSNLLSMGVRKLVKVSNSSSPTNEIGDGAEITYQTLDFDDQQSLDDFVEGKEVKVTVTD